MAATHPLAEAAARAGRQTDAILGAQEQGEAVDQRIEQLAALTEASAAVRAELIAAAQELGAVAGQQESGSTPRFWTWYRSQVGAIIAHAMRLGYDPESLDIRKPGWRPT